MPLSNQLFLITGPVRSGKSEWAEELASRSGKAVTYIATASVDDTDLDWQARIQRHQQRRPAEWTTIHVPIALAETIQAAQESDCLLVDSLGTWLANLLDQDADTWNETEQTLLKVLQPPSSTVILVAEETGWGVVPAYALGRTFRDRLGHLTRQLGAIAHTVYLVTAGHALDLTALGTPLLKPDR